MSKFKVGDVVIINDSDGGWVSDEAKEYFQGILGVVAVGRNSYGLLKVEHEFTCSDNTDTFVYPEYCLTNLGEL